MSRASAVIGTLSGTVAISQSCAQFIFAPLRVALVASGQWSVTSFDHVFVSAPAPTASNRHADRPSGDRRPCVSWRLFCHSSLQLTSILSLPYPAPPALDRK